MEYRPVERRTKPIDLAPGEKLVIRTWRWDEQTLLKDAEDDFYVKTAKGQPPSYYSISTFALTRAQGETVDELADRLRLCAAEHRRFKWYCLVTEPELTGAGLQLILSEPPDDHHDVLLGANEIAPELAAKLVMLFGDEKIRMRT